MARKSPKATAEGSDRIWEMYFVPTVFPSYLLLATAEDIMGPLNPGCTATLMQNTEGNSYIPVFSFFLEPLEIVWTLVLEIKSVFITSLVLCKTGIHLSKKKKQA